jgi:integrase
MPSLKLKEVDGVWHVTGTVAGKRVRKSLGTRDKKAAEEIRVQYEAKLWKRHTYGEAAVRTFEEAAVSYQEQGGEGRFLPPILKHFKGRNLGSIKPAEIRSAAITLYPKATGDTRNRQVITPARAVINHGHDLGWCPPIKVKQFEVSKSRKHKPVDEAWLAAFLAQSDQDKLFHLSALVLFMNRTATRVSEAIRLHGEFVDLSARIAILEETKEGEWETAHLTADVVMRLAALGLRDGEPVFRYTDRSAVNRRMAVVCKRAKIDPRTTHSAGRHSFGTNAMNLPDAKVKDAMDAGRWKSAKLFMETYVHSHEAGKSVAEKLDRQIGPTGMKLASVQKRKGYRFGKKG